MMEPEPTDSRSLSLGPAPPPPPPPPSVAAPPTAPGPLANTVRQPIWPNVVGIIALVLGGGGVLMSLLSAAGPVVVLLGSRGSEPEWTDEVHGWIWAGVALECVSVLLAAALVLGGVGLLRRKRRSGRLLVAWAGCKLVFALALAVVSYGAMAAQSRAAHDAEAGMAAFSWSLGLGFTLIGFVWALLLPVFVLIWFRRANIKAEIANWH